MEIRRLREDEWEDWRDLRLRALAEDPDAFGSTLERELGYSDEVWRERTAALAASEDRAMFLAEDGASLAGCAGVFLDDGGTPWMVSMWVDAGVRGEGAGGALLGAVEGWARSRGCRRLALHVVDGNGGAEALYVRAGFRRTGRSFPLPRDARLVQVEMEKDLAPG